MTYQVSYCIYTAATIEAQQLRSVTQKTERDAAASRLSDAVRVLQNEAAHSPGSGRSLDTIRRILSASEQPKLGHNQPHPNVPPHTTSTGWDTQAMSTSDSHAMPQAGASQGPQQPTPATRSDFAAQYSPFPVMSNGVLWGGDYRFGGTDTGAGFQPDALPWAVGLGTPSNGPGWWHETRSWE